MKNSRSLTVSGHWRPTKAKPEFDEKFLDVGDEASLQLALQEGFGGGEEVEEVGVFQQTLRDVGVDGGQGVAEVCNGGPLAFMGSVFDLEAECVAGPTLLQSLAGIPIACGEVFDFLNQNHIVKPWDAEKEIRG
jgi:hypothetical protein